MRRFVDYASNGRRAYPIVGLLFDNIVARLRRDPRFSAVPTSEFDLLLAEVRADAEMLLVRELRDRVHLKDIGEDR